MERAYVITPQAPPKQVITVINGGAHRGARENLRAFSAFNRESDRAELSLVYADPALGRAAALSEAARKQGVRAQAFEGRVEDALDSADAPKDGPIVLNPDRASANAAVLRKTEDAGRPTLGYLLVKLPSGRVWAVRFVLEAHDRDARRAAAAFFERLADVSERGGSEAFTSDPGHTLAEPAIRQWFADHTQRNLAKLVAGVEPATATFEVTTNGLDTLPLHIVTGDKWSDPETLAAALVASPASPIRRGSAFVVAETTPEGIRFHEVRRRTDGRAFVRGSDAIDREAVGAAEARRSAARTQAAGQQPRGGGDGVALTLLLVGVAAALSRAERQTASRSNPVLTTD